MKKLRKGKTSIGGQQFLWGTRTYVMGVINVTPDSFSGDGINGNSREIVKKAICYQDCGADIIDVGGESTRPVSVYADAEPVSEEEELSRVIPAIEAIVSEVSLPVSIDTYKASVARRAIDAGASMINDVWGLQRDPNMIQVALESKVPTIVMHNQIHNRYNNLIPDVINGLHNLITQALDYGIDDENLIVDPGIGFGKNAEQNLDVIRRLDEFSQFGRPLLVGISRKSTIGHVLNLPASKRIEGTAASVALSIAGGADIVRVHDVKEMVRVVRMSDAIVRGWKQS